MNKSSMSGIVLAFISFSGITLNAWASSSNPDFTDPVGDAYGGYKYDITGMDVTWHANDNVLVKVYTNFAGKSGLHSAGGKKVMYGDLLIDTSPSNLNWDHAFMLDKNDTTGGIRNSNPTSATDGYLVSYAQGNSPEKNSVRDWHGSLSGRSSRYVTSASIGQTDKDVGEWYTGAGFISFAFNVSALNLADSQQMAFRWAMTCFNDSIIGTAYRSTNTQVPEPAAIALMLSGLAGLGFIRRRRTTTEQLEAY